MSFHQELRSTLWHLKRPLLVGVGCLILVDGIDLALPILIMFALDALTGAATPLSAFQCGLIYLLLVCVQSLARFTYRIKLNYASTECAHNLRAKLSKALFEAKFNPDPKHSSGEILNRANSDIETISGMCDFGIITLFDALFYLLLIPPLLFWFTPTLALPVLAPLLLIPLIVRIFDKRISALYKKIQEALDTLLTFSQESIMGIRVIKSLAVEASASAKFAGLASEYAARNRTFARTESLLGPTFEATLTIGTFIAITIGGSAVLAGTISIGSFVILQKYARQLLWPMQALGVTLGNFQRTKTSLARFHDLLLELPAEATGTTEKIVSPMHLEIEGLRYQYPNTASPILEDVSFQVRSREVVVILGNNGAGKSTLLSLIIRIFEPQSGRILISDSDYKLSTLGFLRSQITLAPQEPFILSGSLRENLLFPSNNKTGITDENILLVLKQSGCGSDLLSLPGGLDAIIGERGITLSGGQKQRVGLLRAILRNSPVLLLDDCFSALDPSTEERIWKYLRSSERTIVFTAQRLSSVRHATKIAVLERGRISQFGTLQSLIQEKDSWFARFYEKQRLAEEVHEYSKNLS
jgi:ATP-binding cassette subfamily B multidrug efflux pump